MSFKQWASSPSYWSICVARVAGAIRRLCQLWLFVSVIQADTELSYCSSLLRLPLDEWQQAEQILRKTHVYAVSPALWISTGLQRLFISHILRDLLMWKDFTHLYSLKENTLFSSDAIMSKHPKDRRRVPLCLLKLILNLCVFVKVSCMMLTASVSMQGTAGLSRVLKESMEWQS